jgi:hypothetical protein
MFAGDRSCGRSADKNGHSISRSARKSTDCGIVRGFLMRYQNPLDFAFNDALEIAEQTEI